MEICGASFTAILDRRRSGRAGERPGEGNQMLTFLRELIDHAEWANAVFFHAWGKSPARDHEEMRQRVGHIIGVQHGFLHVLKGETPGRPPDGPPPGFDELKDWARRVHAELHDYAAGLEADGLA